MRLNFVCVQTTNYLGRGKEYVTKLLDGARRNMPADVDARYWVITDDPKCVPDYATAIPAEDGPHGWWHLLESFKPGQFPAGERCMFSDLDQVITGSLADIARYTGPFAMLRDVYHPQRCGDGVTLWTAGEADHVWTTWVRGGMPMFNAGPPGGGVGGSQWWTENAMGGDRIVRLQDVFPGQLASYKVHARPWGRLPDNCRILFFHGLPRPHEVTDPWFAEIWNPAIPQKEPTEHAFA